MLGYYNYTVYLTYIGMLSAFMGLVQAFEGNIFNALLCLMFSGFCDMFDGKIASTRERTDSEKAFGIQIDSLSDLICFGVLPAIIVYQTNPRNKFNSLACALYLLCALIRLAYFNVDEAERQEETDEARKVYEGLPVTTSAVLLPLSFLIPDFQRLPQRRILTSLLVLMAVCFLTPFKLKKPKLVGKIILLLVGVVEVVGMFLMWKGMH